MSDEKTIIITGGNSGLGFECARNIARILKYRVILACRDMKKATAAKERLTQESGNPNVSAMELDVSSLVSVRAFAARYKQGAYPLDGLVCNAGINGMQTGRTPEGFDVVFATNHLGHFLLTHLLLPSFSPSWRVAVVSSDMHCPPGEALTWPGAEALAHPDEALGKSNVRYSFSKLCTLYFTYELSARLVRNGSDITVNALNPGLMVDTGFAPDKSRYTESFMQRVSDRVGSLEKSAAALAQLATEPRFEQVTGKYFDRGTEPIRSSSLSYNTENALELWNMSVEYAGLAQNETLPGLLF
jgi:NAD(P)-dependent dehydrogenase (short-subunit alcohol dehydrogenase family)